MRNLNLFENVQELRLSTNRVLKPTPVFETYWRFAAERQRLFMRRVAGESPPWTEDAVLNSFRFTNAYRASDRVSQFLIREVQYKGDQSPEEVFFRTLLFKFFNRVSTWNRLNEELGSVHWGTFDAKKYCSILDRASAAGERLYSAAYIMPSPPFGNPRKHRNHLALLEHMMKTRAPERVQQARSLKDAFKVLRSYPSLGDFLAYQFAIDLNYSSLINFSEMEFVVAGPGAKDGIRKCFVEVRDVPEAEIIKVVAEVADQEFARLGLKFETLWGRPLQLIDCQNLFCEVDKYARVMHPEVKGKTGRTRIKQKFSPRSDPLPQWYPPKWHLSLPNELTRAKRVHSMFTQ